MIYRYLFICMVVKNELSRRGEGLSYVICFI